MCSVLNIELGVLASWFKLMENHYHSQNPYHNSTHAADVLQATAYFVKRLQDNLIQQGVSVAVFVSSIHICVSQLMCMCQQ